ncbi:hypothetical protein HMPREF0063_12667 [Aeromicrobium marinum DSM 15272]|uniref:Uncharacterized protein n=1 Tax=Aeromicrobium marinum DSM 15272 TaxID=585531 RepID=E2SF58_9ACTN|nr:hypothetical protein [Aeromicrobium marinum]EFQ82143.1 hypothetical protein HMPREF0063_12667 [Aeromicrobium marinum DSM 15272]
MTAFRWVLGAAGVAVGAWGVWLTRDFSGEQFTSLGLWLVGGVALHDAILAPLVVLLGVVAVRVLPGYARPAVATVFCVWATVSMTAVAVLSGQGGRSDNDSILNRPYLTSWLVLTAVAVVVAAGLAWSRRPREPIG